MNLCGVCSPRVASGDRHQWRTCDGCGIVTDTVYNDPDPVAIAPRAVPPTRSPWPARTRLVPSLRVRR